MSDFIGIYTWDREPESDYKELKGDYYQCKWCGDYIFKPHKGEVEYSDTEMFPENHYDLIKIDKCDQCKKDELEEEILAAEGEKKLSNLHPIFEEIIATIAPSGQKR